MSGEVLPPLTRQAKPKHVPSPDDGACFPALPGGGDGVVPGPKNADRASSKNIAFSSVDTVVPMPAASTTPIARSVPAPPLSTKALASTCSNRLTVAQLPPKLNTDNIITMTIRTGVYGHGGVVKEVRGHETGKGVVGRAHGHGGDESSKRQEFGHEGDGKEEIRHVQEGMAGIVASHISMWEKRAQGRVSGAQGFFV